MIRSEVLIVFDLNLRSELKAQVWCKRPESVEGAPVNTELFVQRLIRQNDILYIFSGVYSSSTASNTLWHSERCLI